MLYILYALTVVAFFCVIFTLVMGAKSMTGKLMADREKSNIWMRRRVLAQAVAIGLLVLTVIVKTKG